EKVLDAQGWNAWPSCSKEHNLKGKAEPNKKPSEIDGPKDDRGLNEATTNRDKRAYTKCTKLEPQPMYAEAHMQKSTIRIGRMVAKRWGDDLEVIGGWRESDPYPDHPSGRAADIMIPNYSSDEGKRIGDEIAEFLSEHKD